MAMPLVATRAANTAERLPEVYAAAIGSARAQDEGDDGVRLVGAVQAWSTL
jgi:hypothetical protein